MTKEQFIEAAKKSLPNCMVLGYYEQETYVTEKTGGVQECLILDHDAEDSEEIYAIFYQYSTMEKPRLACHYTFVQAMENIKRDII